MDAVAVYSQQWSQHGVMSRGGPRFRELQIFAPLTGSCLAQRQARERVQGHLPPPPPREVYNRARGGCSSQWREWRSEGMHRYTYIHTYIHTYIQTLFLGMSAWSGWRSEGMIRYKCMHTYILHYFMDFGKGGVHRECSGTHTCMNAYMSMYNTICHF